MARVRQTVAAARPPGLHIVTFRAFHCWSPGGHDDAHDRHRPRGRVPLQPSAGIRCAEGEVQAMAPAVTGGPAGTGEDLIAAGLPCRAGLERVHHASYPGVPEAVSAARHHVAGVLAGVPAAEDVVYAVSEVASN